jgi:hypothetical protein
MKVLSKTIAIAFVGVLSFFTYAQAAEDCPGDVCNGGDAKCCTDSDGNTWWGASWC